MNPIPDFHSTLSKHHLTLSPRSIETLQINLTKLCNQACHHCHVDASPKRTESMDDRTMKACLEVITRNKEIKVVDITGGAPELHPKFEWLVKEVRNLGRHIIVRHNLTVTIDGHPHSGESKGHLPDFFSQNRIELIASLPCYTEQNTNAQRGKDVFEKSIESLHRLNRVGYGREGSGLILNLAYNPGGAFLPGDQANLERDYKRELGTKYDIVFNQLYTITNMPIHRFRNQLVQWSKLDEYMTLLVDKFSPKAAEGVMCKTMLSVGYDGKLYDCDFNQMLELPVHGMVPQTIFDFDSEPLLSRHIQFREHCYGCTAGAGSSCAGAIVSSSPIHRA